MTAGPTKRTDPMPDIFSKRKRSAVMALIRSRGNQATELRLSAIFRALANPSGQPHKSAP